MKYNLILLNDWYIYINGDDFCKIKNQILI